MAESVAVIGSFRQHYSRALEAVTAFRDVGWVVTSPIGTPVIEPGLDFVRFESDDADLGDAMVQTLALHRILRADVVYVVAPDGYVGRTTCYEIGRAVQARRPVYFSERPRDLPIAVPSGHIASPSELVVHLSEVEPTDLLADGPGPYADWERRLLTGEYLTN